MEELYRAAFRKQPACRVLVQQGQVLDITDYWMHLLGGERAQWTGRQWNEGVLAKGPAQPQEGTHPVILSLPNGQVRSFQLRWAQLDIQQSIWEGTLVVATEGEYPVSPQLLIDSLPVGLLVRRDDHILMVNRAFVEQLGYTREELEGKTLHDLILPHEAEHMTDLLAEEGETKRRAYAVHQQGYEVPLEVSRTYLPLEGETLVLNSIVDITDRIETDRLLAEANDRMQLTLAAARVGLWSFDTETKYLTGDPHSARLMNLTQKQGNENYEDFIARIHEEEREAFQHSFYESLRHNQDFEFDYRFEVVPGTFRFFRSRARHYPDAHLVLGVVTDIHDQKMAEVQAMAKLAAETDRQAQLISAITNTSPSLMYVRNVRTGNYEFGNAAAREILGISSLEFQGMTPTEMRARVHPDDLPTLERNGDLYANAAPDDIIGFEFRYLHRDGHYVWLRAVERPLAYDPEGALDTVVGVANDITTEKEQEEEDDARMARLERLQEGLSELATGTGSTLPTLKDGWLFVASLACETIQANFMSLWFLREGNLYSDFHYDNEFGHINSGLTLQAADHPVYFERIYSGQPMFVNDVFDNTYTKSFAPYFREYGIGALMDIPLYRHGKLIGILCLEHKGGPRKWYAEEKAFATAVADTVMHIETTFERKELLQALQAQEEELRSNLEELQTAQEHLRDARLEAERRTREIESIMNATNDFIFALDREYRLLHFNNATRQIFMVMGHQLKAGMPLYETARDDDWARYKAFIDQAMSGKPLTREISYDVLPGETRYYVITFAPIRTKEGITGVVGYARDITARKQVEIEIQDKNMELQAQSEELQSQSEELRVNLERLEEYNLELERARTELRATLSKLQAAQSQLVHAEKMSSLGQLTAGIAHEINNPINFVHGGVDALAENLHALLEISDLYTQLDTVTDAKNLKQQLADIRKRRDETYFDVLRAKLPSLVENIKIGTTRTADIVRSLKSFSRLDEAERKKADLHEGLDNTLLLLGNKLKHSRIEVQKEYDPNLKAIECYPGQLNQVFMNLLNNAIEAIEASDKGQGVLRIRTQGLKNGTEIEISDTGTGMPPAILNRVFEPFFTTKEIGKGTGLGLFISYGIIEQHGGHIDVASQPNEGTTFRIFIPHLLPTSSPLA